MPASAGYIAIVQIGSSPLTITGIKTADIKVQGEIYDITAFSDGQWKVKIGGLADYTVSFAGNLDMTDAQQAVLQAAIITNPGTVVPWAVFPLGTGVGKPKYSGSCLLKGESVKFQVSSEQQTQFDLDSTGPLVYTPGS